MGVAVSSSRVVSGLLPPQGRTPHIFPLPQHESFPPAQVLHELPQRASLPTGCSPSGTGCSSVGPPQGRKPAPAWAPLSAGPTRSLLQCRLPTGSLPSAGIRLLRCGVLRGLQVDICSTLDLHGLQGDSLPHRGLQHGLQGRISALVPGAPPPPSSFTDLGVCRVVSLAYSHSSLSSAVPQQVFPLLKYVITDALPPSLMGSALASSGSVVELVGIGSIRYGGNF